ncbi:MAG: hypothetical protein JRN67_13290, partial [Nitrososphaerota archaeon]|nr:hypothetical protein [Nitrososphaerota archaeon]
KKTLDKVIENIKEESRKVLLFTIGLNPHASPFYGVDRFVKGAVTLNIGFRLTPLLTKASISVDGKELVSSGRIFELI